VTFVSAGELAAMKDIERIIGYPLGRISLPDYDYEGGGQLADKTPKAVVNRGGGRMGSKRAGDLSAEQLKQLLG
jgi:hypothetical protein